MIVTRLEEMERSKFKVFLDDSFAFCLYKKEIEQLGLMEGKVISNESYEEIMHDTIYRRAKQKALAVLKYMDRTEQELCNKLFDAGYPGSIIEKTMMYVKEYGYINNERFTSSYIRARMNSKSKIVIKMELIQKGVSKEIVERILCEEYIKDAASEDAEIIAIKKAVAKKTKDVETLNNEDKKKLMASLYRKGFDIGKIRHVIK